MAWIRVVGFFEKCHNPTQISNISVAQHRIFSAFGLVLGPLLIPSHPTISEHADGDMPKGANLACTERHVVVEAASDGYPGVRRRCAPECRREKKREGSALSLRDLGFLRGLLSRSSLPTPLDVCKHC